MGSVCMLPIDSIIKQRSSNIRNVAGIQRLVRDVRTAMDVRSNKEIRMMTDKNEKMKKTINDMNYENAEAMRKLESMRAEIKRDSYCVIKQGDDNNKLQALIKKCDITKKNLQVEAKQKERLEKIIDICKLNKDSNEEWIRQLNFLISNLSKMSTKMEKKAERLSKETAEIQKLYQNLEKQQNIKKHGVTNLVQEVRNNMKLQHNLDRAFMEEYSATMEEAHTNSDMKKFANELMHSQHSLEKPKLQASKEEKAADKEQLQLLGEFESDLEKLSNLLGIQEAEILKTKGRLMRNPKLQGIHVLTYSLLRSRGSARVFGHSEEQTE